MFSVRRRSKFNEMMPFITIHICLHEEHNNAQGGMAASLTIHLLKYIYMFGLL